MEGRFEKEGPYLSVVTLKKLPELSCPSWWPQHQPAHPFSLFNSQPGEKGPEAAGWPSCSSRVPSDW